MGASVPEEDRRATRAFYDRISRAYDLLSDASEHAARERGLELLAAGEGERVLEVGYGTGHALADLAASVGPGGSVAGVDISPGMRKVARKRLRKAGVEDRVELRVDAAPPLPFDDGAFDAAFMAFTLELFPEDVIPELLAEVRRVLRPGGRLGVVAMDTGTEGHRHSLIERAYDWMHRHFPHIVDCRPIDAAAVVRRAGFSVVRTVSLDLWTLPVCVLLAMADDGRTAGRPPRGS